jgi:hypothetical protein
MKLGFLFLMMLVALGAPRVSPQRAEKALTKTQLLNLVQAGMETPDLVKLIHEHGIDFELTDDYLQALRSAGAQEPVIQALHDARPKPLSKEQVLQLVVGHVPSERAAMLVAQHGIDFVADDDYLETLRLAGADESVIAAVREASKAVTGELRVTTSPGAQVFLDGAPQGQADDEHYYQSSPPQDPPGPASGQSHVVRGGAWGVSARGERLSTRPWFQPTVFSNLGFRCVWETGRP